MELRYLEEAILQHNQGLFEFQGRNDLHCFLYKNTWYPIRAFVNKAMEIAGEQTALNLRNSLDKLQDILPYVIQKSMVINYNTPRVLTDQEKLLEGGV